MDAERYARVTEVFLAVVERPPEERGDLLTKLCGDDGDLRREVERLLETDSQSVVLDHSPLETRLRAAVECGSRTEGGTLPRAIGRYEILGLLGQGGMGVVYRARQLQPSRIVALKVMHAGLATPEMVRRFEFEAAVLGRLAHPGIGQIYEAGVAEQGGMRIPFFAMEFVEGCPLTEFANARGIGQRERLALLIALCEAVQHAHQKGVIHRDLKPANILVDTSGRPRILDFGIARALDADATAVTRRTAVGALVGTIPYMSPEQVAGTPDQIDTRTDIYALGVIGYELLSGRLPHELRGSSITQAVMTIRDVEPPRLGTLAKGLRGDPEIIIGRAMEKEKERRYGSAAELAADIRRLLRDEPIVARAPTMRYRMRKFVRRHRGAVLASAGAVLVLIAATVISITFAIGEARERRRTQQVADFQSNMFRDIDMEAMGRGLKAMLSEQVRAGLERRFVQDGQEWRRRSPEEIEERLRAFEALTAPASAIDVARRMLDEFVLERAASSLEGQFAEQPVVRAKLHRALGDAYAALGIPRAAEKHFEKSIELWRGQRTADHETMFDLLANLGNMLHNQQKCAAAEERYREALSVARERIGTDSTKFGTGLLNLGTVLARRAKFEEAERLEREALELFRRHRGTTSREVAVILNNLSELMRALGRMDEAERMSREAVEIRRGDAAADPREIGVSVNNLANLLTATGRYREAEPLQQEAVQIFKQGLGDEHPLTVTAIHNLANTLLNLQSYATAEAMFREAIALHERVHGAGDPGIVNSYAGLGVVLQERNDVAGAEAAHRTAVGILRPNADRMPLELAASLNNLASVLLEAKRIEEAEPLYHEALEIRKRLFGADHPDVAWVTHNLGTLCREAGRHEESAGHYREAIRIWRRTSPPHPNLAASTSSLGRTLFAAGKYAEAEACFRDALDLLASRYPSGHEQIELVRIRLGRTIGKQGRFPEAAALLTPIWRALGEPATAKQVRSAGIEAGIEIHDEWEKYESGKGHAETAEEFRAMQEATLE